MKVEQLTIPIQIRNRDLIPHLENEGYFWKPLPIPKQTDLHQQQQQKRAPLQAHRRLFYHQTLNSARKTVLYQPFEQCVAHDSLDFVLASVYNDKIKLHANKADVLMQMETKGHQTARRLKNTIDINPEHIPVLGHPLQIGGITTKLSPHSVKLAHSGHHTPLTNKGYSRQPLDGNIYNY